MLPQSFTPQFLRQLELFKIRSRRAYLGARQGGHVSLKRGHGIEFSDYRKYEMGDSPRWIDWGVYARTDRLYVRRYQEEETLSVLVILDTSASMLVPPEDKKWEMARDIGIALSYVALLEQDNVMVSALGTPGSPTYHGGRAVHQLGAALLNLEMPQGPRDLVRETELAVSRVRFPGVAVFISDFLMPFVEIRKIFNNMMARNLDITAIQVLGPHDLKPLEANGDAIAVDSETGEEIELSLDDDARGKYNYLLGQHNKQIREFFGSRRIGYASVRSNEDLSTFTLSALSKTGLIR
jgi:uncharacterized protein (DUF58 family)